MTCPTTPAGDRAGVTVTVAVPPERAVRLFTEEINLCCRRGPRFPNLRGDQGIISLEPHVGRRVFEAVGAATN